MTFVEYWTYFEYQKFDETKVNQCFIKTLALIFKIHALVICKFGINFAYKAKQYCQSKWNSAWTLLTKLTYGVTEIWQNRNESTFHKNFVTLFQILVNNMLSPCTCHMYENLTQFHSYVSKLNNIVIAKLTKVILNILRYYNATHIEWQKWNSAWTLL